jgi:hypothetical protein
MLNGWAATAVKPLVTPEAVYRLAGCWIKQPTHTKGGYAASCVTIEEDAKYCMKKPGSKKPEKGEAPPRKSKRRHLRKNQETCGTSNASNARSTDSFQVRKSVSCTSAIQKRVENLQV